MLIVAEIFHPNEKCFVNSNFRIAKMHYMLYSNGMKVLFFLQRSFYVREALALSNLFFTRPHFELKILCSEAFETPRRKLSKARPEQCFKFHLKYFTSIRRWYNYCFLQLFRLQCAEINFKIYQNNNFNDAKPHNSQFEYFHNKGRYFDIFLNGIVSYNILQNTRVIYMS